MGVRDGTADAVEVVRSDLPDGPLAARLRALPSVERLAACLDAPHGLAVIAARAAIDACRAELRAGTLSANDDLVGRARAALAAAELPSLRRVVNATGVVLHTNLGRAPLANAAREAVACAAHGYANLELDLETGERGSRHAHVEGLLRELTGAEAALVVNNCAAATLLCAAALGGGGRGIVVSRGQLVEIGGGFRVPEVIAASGARLVEVGTTNRTRVADYAAALAPDVAAILRVHPSNFRTLGFVEEASIEELCALEVPVIDDVGSGALAEDVDALAGEPSPVRSVRAGAALVCCSGDKLLGGPQAGLVLGRAEALARARRHPLARAMRIDKLSLAALEATLRLYREPERARREIPTLAMLDASEEELAARAGRLLARLAAGGVEADVIRSSGRVGGGALPLLELEGPVVAIGGRRAQELAAALRAADPPVIARVSDARLLLDPRTLTDEDADLAAAAVLAAHAA